MGFLYDNSIFIRKHLARSVSVLVVIVWVVDFITTGSLATVTGIVFTKNVMYELPFGIPRIFDAAFAFGMIYFMVTILIYVRQRLKKIDKEVRDIYSLISVLFVVPLLIGLLFALLVGLKQGLIMGLLVAISNVLISSVFITFALLFGQLLEKIFK